MKKTLCFALTLLMMLTVLSFTVNAAESISADGLEITLTTDKDEYVDGEKVDITLLVKNTNPYTVENVKVVTYMPECLGGGESKTIKVNKTEIEKDETLTLKGDAVVGESVAVDTTDASSDGESKQKKGGLSVGEGILMIILIIFAGVVVVGAAIIVKKVKADRIIGLLLCLSMLLSAVPANVEAANSPTPTVRVARNITVNGERAEIKCNVTYDLNVEYEAECTVTFESCGGTPVEPVKVRNGEVIDTLPLSEKEGNMLVGWYLDPAYNTRFVFSRGVYRSCTLYARWLDITDTTDNDGDGLTNPMEQYYETDPDNADTDSDGLNDFVEVSLGKYDPCRADTDGDKVSDAYEDFDNDWLNNAQELSLSSEMAMEDTDGDGLNDGEEFSTYKTSPIKYDTDGDGANDGWEVENGFDPLSYNSSFSVEVKSKETLDEVAVTASVRMETSGAQAASLSVEIIEGETEPMLSPVIPGYVGPAYEFEAIDPIEEPAVIEFHYDPTIYTVSGSFQPRIYYFNEETGRLEELEGQRVSEGKVSVSVSHFSKYILLNKIDFDEAWENDIKPPMDENGVEGNGALDIMFVIDYSSSMDGNDPNQLFKDVSEKFIDKLRDGKDRAGAVKFIRRATLVSDLTTDKAAAISAIRGIEYDDGYGTYSGTDGSTGIKMGLDKLLASDSRYKYIVFLTDGQDNGHTYDYDDLVQTAADNKVRIYAIGLGSASESVLRKISENTEGKYYHAKTGVNLDDVFSDIESETIDLTTDSNGDKIPNYFNERICDGTLPLSNGSTQFEGIDFNYNANGEAGKDYDGDGIINGKEIVVVKKDNIVYLEMKSDPTKADTDGDGIIDGKDSEPKKWNVSDRDLAMCASIVYADVPAGTHLPDIKDKDLLKTINFHLKRGCNEDSTSLKELQGWYVLDTWYGDGMQCAAYIKDDNVVVAYRGSEDLGKWDSAEFYYDWWLADGLGFLTGLNYQATNACSYVSMMMAVARGCDFYITGHSLGGNLSYNSAITAFTINSDVVKGVSVFNALGFMEGVCIFGDSIFTDVTEIPLILNEGKIKNFRVEGDIVSELPYTRQYGRTINNCKKCKNVDAHDMHSFLHHTLPRNSPNS